MFSSIIFNLQLWPSSVTPLFHLKLKTPFYKSFPPLSANSLQAAFLELHTGLDRTCSTIFVLILTRVTIFSFGSCTRLSCWQASIRVHVNHHHPFCNITLAYLCYNFSACQLIFQLACRSLSPISIKVTRQTKWFKSEEKSHNCQQIAPQRNCLSLLVGPPLITLHVMWWGNENSIFQK